VKEVVLNLQAATKSAIDSSGLVGLIMFFFSGLQFADRGDNESVALLNSNGIREIDRVIALHRLYPNIIKNLPWSFLFRGNNSTIEGFIQLLREERYTSDRRFKEMVRNRRRINRRSAVGAPVDGFRTELDVVEFTWYFSVKDERWLERLAGKAAVSDWAAACDKLLIEIQDRKKQRSTMILDILKIGHIRERPEESC
jgi:hypothetical protein